MLRRVPLAAWTLLAFAGAAAAQGPAPAGAEFRVHGSTLATQENPDVFYQPDGRFVAAWGDADGNGFGVRAQRFDRAGAPLGAPFQVNTYTTGQQRLYGAARSVAGDGKGRFVVAWVSYGQDGDRDGVFARRFAADVAPLGPELQVNTYTTDDQAGISLGMARDGRFVLSWHSRGQDGSLLGVFARRYDAYGGALGAEFQVNEYTTSGQLAPDVAVKPDGGFAVVWMSAQDGSGNSVHGRVFDPSGAPLGPEFRVNTTTAFGQTFPVVAAVPAGFVVAWESDAQDGSDDGIFAQRFDSGGGRVGAEFRVNTYTTARQAFPAIAADASGRFTVAWESLGQDGALYGVHGQRFAADGAPLGSEFQVNTTTAGSQQSARIASDPYGNLLAAWDGPDGSGTGAFAQRYGGLRPTAYAPLGTSGGVMELPQNFALLTFWLNVTGSTQQFQGTFSDFVLPPGLVLNAAGSTAAYGPVDHGLEVFCEGLCFSGDLLGTRPPGHVDVSVLETIAPAVQGQVVRRALHVGSTFSDVPRTNPFYPYVELLLHRGITGGCSATEYCPSLATTREQMAVFVLAAKDGAGYPPPPCSPPNLFGDVPEGSPFCRWIEELAGRGVVGGCGGGNYCPTQPVTREQMAVFVLRTLDAALDPPACVAGSETFADVPASSPFCRWIEELARRGVVSGCGGGNYCPTQPVTREQMGVFISLTFGLSLYGP